MNGRGGGRDADQSHWIERLQENHPEQPAALRELREILLRGLRSALLRRGADEAFCEDVAQEAIIQILKKLDTFEGRSKFTTWAISIGIRMGIGQMRRKYFKDVSLDAVVGSGEFRFDVAEVAGTDPTDFAFRKTILEKLQELIDNELTDKQRTVVRALLGGMPVEEIARRTDSNRNAIYKLFHDGRQRLKRGFEAANFSATEIQAAFS